MQEESHLLINIVFCKCALDKSIVDMEMQGFLISTGSWLEMQN